MNDADEGAAGFGNSSLGGWYKGFHWLSTVVFMSCSVVTFPTVVELPGVLWVSSWCVEATKGIKPGTREEPVVVGFGTNLLSPGANPEAADCLSSVFLNLSL